MPRSPNVLLAVLLPQSTHQSETPDDFGQRSLVAVRHPKIVEGGPAYRPSVVELLAARRRVKGRYIA